MVVLAAADWSRTGITQPISRNTLVALAEKYAERSGVQKPGPKNIEIALAWAQKRVYGVSQLLLQATEGFMVPDYVLDHVAETPIPDEIWDAAIQVAHGDEFVRVGLAAYEQNRLDIAACVFEIAVQSSTPLVDATIATYNYARTLERLNRPNEALEYYLKAASADHAEAAYAAGRMYEARGDIGQARQNYQAAALAGHPDAAYAFGTLLRTTDLDRALTWAGKTINTRDHPVVERKVKVLMAGYSASGKTLMLAALYNYFGYGTPAGIRFTTDAASHYRLADITASITDPRRLLPGSTQGTKRWEFTVRVESVDQEANAFTLEYLDYPGSFGDRTLNPLDPALAEEVDSRLKQELKSADVLMIVLDGQKLVKLMRGNYDARIAGDIDRLLESVIRTGHRNIQLVVTKWDLMRGPDGAYYTVSDVRQVLDRVSGTFRFFRLNPRLGARMRIIPVSALGLNGFVRQDQAERGIISRQPGFAWSPWNVTMPFFAIMPDMIASDVRKLVNEHAEEPPRSGLMILCTVLLASVKVPAGYFLHQIIKSFPSRKRRSTAPYALTSESALSYVLNESYAALREFEAQMPDTPDAEE
jgi:tetratricopeptide (TPR) repeat protein